MIFALVREKFDGAHEAVPGFQAAAQSGIGGRPRQKIGLPGDAGGRMCVGIGNQLVAVQGREHAVHGRVGGQPGFQGVDAPGHGAVTFLQGRKGGKGPEDGKMRGPDVRGNKDGLRACVEDDLNQVAAVQPQNGPAVGMDIADDFQPAGELLGRLQGGQQNQVVHLTGFAVPFIDGTDFAGNDEADFFFSGQGKRQAQRLSQSVKARAVFLQTGLHFLPPGGVGKISRAQKAHALFPGPQIQMRKIAIPAGGPGIFGMDVQIGNVHGRKPPSWIF